VLGVQDASTELSRWQVSTAWRYQRSDRHFRGTEEEENRQEEGSEVINTIHLLDVSIRYNLNNRWSFSLGAPYLMGIEGALAEDLIGGSEGFRRPGYAISLEPGLNYGLGLTCSRWRFQSPSSATA
jgi:hypothetical protein